MRDFKAERPYLFANETPSYMGISWEEFDLLAESELLPPLHQTPGTCIFFFLTSDIDALKHKLAPGGALHGRLDFLMSRSREE